MSKTLAMKFELESGDSRTISLSYPKDDLSEGDVTACMGSMIEAGDAFEDAPVEILKATLTEREVTVLIDNE